MMDDERVNEEFGNIAFNEYAASIDQFIEFTRVTELGFREAMANGDAEDAATASTKVFLAANSVQVGNIPNLVMSYARTLNEERAAGVEVYDLILAVLKQLRDFHQHLVYVNQPNRELLMVTDMVADLTEKVAETSYGQMEGK